MNEVQNDAAAWTVARLLGWTREFLQRHGVDSPRLCAEILLAAAMQCERIHLYTRFDQIPADDVRTRFRELVKEAATGRPIAYLVGTKEFFSLTFEVTPDVLIPRPETEILVERVIDLVRKRRTAAGDEPTILDLGTGSGCIAVSLARNLRAARICASDISEAVLAVARRNAARHDVVRRIEFRQGDLFEPWQEAGVPVAFDVVVCNPPYVATRGPLDANVRDHEPHVALFAGEDGLDIIRRLVAGAPRFVKPAGHLLLEVACDHADHVRGLFPESAWRDIVTYRDGAGHERVVHARRMDAATSPPVGRRLP